MFGRKKRETVEPMPLSESMLDLQGVFRGQRNEYGHPLIEMRCVWCQRGAGVDALDGFVPEGWYHYADPHRVKARSPFVKPSEEDWRRALAEGSTNMDDTSFSMDFSWAPVNYIGDGAMCPDCGDAAADALHTAYMSRVIGRARANPKDVQHD